MATMWRPATQAEAERWTGGRDLTDEGRPEILDVREVEGEGLEILEALVCAECGTRATDHSTFVVTFHGGSRTEVCRSCDDEIREGQ